MIAINADGLISLTPVNEETVEKAQPEEPTLVTGRPRVLEAKVFKINTPRGIAMCPWGLRIISPLKCFSTP